MTDQKTTAGSKEWLEALNKSISTLGSDEFEDHLFTLVNSLLRVDHCTVFVSGEGGKTEHLFTKSTLDEKVCIALARAYTDGFYVDDPNRAPLAKRVKTSQNNKRDVTILPHTPTEDYDKKYQEEFFNKTGLNDKISSLLQTTRYNIYCSFYRLKPSPVFKDHEFQQLSKILPLLTNLIFKHLRLKNINKKEILQTDITIHTPLSRSPEMLSEFLDSKSNIFAALTGREKEVCSRIITGYSSEAIALDLKVALSTIHTYRKRAYSKLGISSQNELFSLCLEFMPLP